MKVKLITITKNFTFWQCNRSCTRPRVRRLLTTAFGRISDHSSTSSNTCSLFYYTHSDTLSKSPSPYSYFSSLWPVCPYYNSLSFPPRPQSAPSPPPFPSSPCWRPHLLAGALTSPRFRLSPTPRSIFIIHREYASLSECRKLLPFPNT